MSSATFSFSFSFPDADGNSIKSGMKTISIPFDVPIIGQLPVPDGTPEGTEIDLPLTGILAAASFLYVENLTGQEINCAWGGNWAPHLAPHASLFYVSPTPPIDGTITSLRFMLTQPQMGRGRIAYVALGE